MIRTFFLFLLLWQVSYATPFVSDPAVMPDLRSFAAKLVALEAKVEGLEAKNVALESTRLILICTLPSFPLIVVSCLCIGHDARRGSACPLCMLTLY